jgi:DUF917 family protein
MRELSRQDVLDMLAGSAILGTGGGGDIAEGLEYIDAAEAAGKSFKMVSVDELAGDAMVCTPYLLGALVPSDGESPKDYARLPKSDTPAIMTAFRRLESYAGKTFQGMIPCELGGANTAVAAYVAAMTDVCLVDADVAGRAVPEITHSTYYLDGLDASPAVLANEFGECFILENLHDDLRAESVVRALAKVSRNDIAVIDHAMPIASVKESLITGTLSKSLELGRAFREARASGDDVAERIAAVGGGDVVFRGEITKADYRDENGFTMGDIVIAGGDEYAGSDYEVSVKNENLASWQDGNLHATIPDLIIVVDLQSDEPATHPNLKPGTNCAVVVLAPPEQFLTEKALEVFGPSYLGLTSPYRPVVRK